MDFNIKDIYAEGLMVGMSLGVKQGLSEAIALLVQESEPTAAAVVSKHYAKLLEEERQGKPHR